MLTSISFVDDALRELWTWLQDAPAYRDSTTIIVTCDHGRGAALNDWHGHGKDIHGSDQVSLAIIGPDTPHTGEAHDAPAYYQRDIAPTVLQLLGVDAAGYPGMLGKPIGPAIG